MANYMREIAGLLGVELKESFKIVSDNGCSCCNCYRFTEEKGIEMSYDNADWEIATAGAGILKQLLMGEAMIAKFPWKPKKMKYIISHVQIINNYGVMTNGMIMMLIITDSNMDLFLNQ